MIQASKYDYFALKETRQKKNEVRIIKTDSLAYITRLQAYTTDHYLNFEVIFIFFPNLVPNSQ
jgi:hypothetical protein